jgi:hypothetical protein
MQPAFCPGDIVRSLLPHSERRRGIVTGRASQHRGVSYWNVLFDGLRVEWAVQECMIEKEAS